MMGDVAEADVTVQSLHADDPEAQAARRRALEQALIGVRAARRARRTEPPAEPVRMPPPPVALPNTHTDTSTETHPDTHAVTGTGEPGGDAGADGGDVWPTVSTLPWIERATCQKADPALFFGPDLLSTDGRRERLSERRRRETEAKGFCAVCPVRPQCAEHALALPEPYGVWGGMGEIERLALLRRTVV